MLREAISSDEVQLDTLLRTVWNEGLRPQALADLLRDQDARLNGAITEGPFECWSLRLDPTLPNSLSEKSNRRSWESFYSKSTAMPLYDGWLDKWHDVFSESKSVLDLGCGRGADSLHLASKGCRVTACDFSTVALAVVKQICPTIDTRRLDISKPLPFPDQSFDAVVADLSLHYFDTMTTVQILKELERILVPQGALLLRVNATAESGDDLKGQKWRQIEEGYYEIDGHRKRYFDRASVDRFFGTWTMLSALEKTTEKYGTQKFVWEVVLRRN